MMTSFYRLSLISFMGFLLFSCGSAPENDMNVQIPPGIMDEEKFSKVLADFALAEGAVNINAKNVQIQRFDTVYAFDPLKDNHASKGQYDSTLAFYAKHPKLYKKVYENALALLSEMQTRRDSIRTDSVSK